MDKGLYIWLKNNIDKYNFSGESLTTKEEFDEIFAEDVQWENTHMQQRAEMCYDMLVYNFYNNIIGYRNGFADREITSENTDCYFIETSDGLLPIGYYTELRPVESTILTHEYIGDCIACLPEMRNNLYETWEKEVETVKDNYEEKKSKKYSSLKKARVSLVFGVFLLLMTLVAFLWIGGFGIFSDESPDMLFKIREGLPMLEMANPGAIKVYAVLVFILMIGAAMFLLAQILEFKHIKTKEAAENVVNNFDDCLEAIKSEMDSDISTGIEDIRLAARQGRNKKTEKSNASKKIEAFENRLTIAKKYAKQLYIYVDPRITMAIIALCVIVSVSYTGLVPALTKLNMYNNAVESMEDHNYSDALSVFETLGNYKDSKEKIAACRYFIAIDLLNSGNADDAKKILHDLGDYKGSTLLMTECDYVIAADALRCGELDEAYQGFKKLGGYKKSKQNLKLTAKKIYSRGVTRYREGLYEEAKKDFGRSVNCGREKDYLLLIKAREGKLKNVSLLYALIDFEDTKDILLTDVILPEFLIGSWSCGDKYIRIDKDEDEIICLQNLFDGELVNVSISAERLHADNDKEKKLKFKITDENTIKVQELINFKWYEFTRD